MPDSNATAYARSDFIRYDYSLATDTSVSELVQCVAFAPPTFTKQQ